MSPLVDTHAHLQSEQFRSDLPRVLDRAARAGVDTVINVGIDLPSSERAVDMVRPGGDGPAVWATAGIHPHYAAAASEQVIRGLARVARSPGVVALGEIGLDYYRDRSPRADQKRVFARLLGLAADMDLPVIVHDRQSTADTYRILSTGGGGLRGVLHCFSAGWEWAEKFLDLGFHISLAGPVTYPGAEDARVVASRIPLGRLLLETDCPYLPPVPHRGRRNEPAWVSLVAEAVARVRGLPVERVIDATRDNAFGLFGLGKSP